MKKRLRACKEEKSKRERLTTLLYSYPVDLYDFFQHRRKRDNNWAIKRSLLLFSSFELLALDLPNARPS